MNKKSWIKFKLLVKKTKTNVWAVVTTYDKPITLGVIKWHCLWRKYAFFPEDDTLYEQQCLKDIINFMDKQMELRMGSNEKRG